MNRDNRQRAITRHPKFLKDFKELIRLRAEDRKTGGDKADRWREWIDEKWGEPSLHPYLYYRFNENYR